MFKKYVPTGRQIIGGFKPSKLFEILKMPK
jgi:hypothetical protein